MIHFRIKDHTVRPGTQLVEILNERDELLGAFYPNDNHTGVRLVSKYLDEDNISIDGRFPMALEVLLP